MQRLKSVGPLSVGLALGLLYGILGGLIGVVFAMLSLVGAGLGEAEGAGPFAMLFGVGAIVLLPLIYGCAGLIAGALMAFLYNLVARITGGIELHLE